MSDAPTQVAPGVHRLGNALVNCYLIEDGNRMTLVDGGLPGFRPQLDAYLRSRGRSVSDIDAVILTHAHSDHVGMVEAVRERRAGHGLRARGRRAHGPHRQGPPARRLACSPTCAGRRSGSCSTSAPATAPCGRRTSSEVTTFTRRRPRRPRPPADRPHAGPLPRPRRVPPARPRRADRGRRALHLQPADRQRAGRRSCRGRSPPTRSRRSPRSRRSSASRPGSCCSATANPGPKARPRRSPAPGKSG